MKRVSVAAWHQMLGLVYPVQIKRAARVHIMCMPAAYLLATERVRM